MATAPIVSEAHSVQYSVQPYGPSDEYSISDFVHGRTKSQEIAKFKSIQSQCTAFMYLICDTAIFGPPLRPCTIADYCILYYETQLPHANHSRHSHVKFQSVALRAPV